MSNTQTYCLGRFLVDIPKEAIYRGQGYDYRYGHIETSAIGEHDFAGKMDQLAKDFKAGKSMKDYPSGYKLRNMISPDAHSRIFVISEEIYGETQISFEVYKWDRGVVFAAKQQSIDEKYIDSEIIPELTGRFLPSLRYRPNDEIPTEAGFCIEQGFIKGDGADPQIEVAHMAFAAKDAPDVWYAIVFERNWHGKVPPTLFERVKDEHDAPPGYEQFKARVRSIRKDERAVGQIQGQEILEALPTDREFYSHDFVWDSVGMPNSASAPSIYFQLQSGQTADVAKRPLKSKMTESALIEYFDKIVNSIRLRPTGHSKVGEADTPPVLPIGELARTGATCPQTGLWKCAESGDVEGGRTQRFEVGATMPQARIKQERDFWKRLQGGATHWDTDTVWQLVAYDEPAKPATEPESSVADSTSTEPRDEQPS